MNKPDNDKQGTESRATAAMQRFLGAVADKALPEEITIAQISGWLGRNYKTLRSDDFARIGVRAGKLVPIQSAGGVPVKYRVNLDNFEKFQRAVRLFCARPDNLQRVPTKMYTTFGADAKNLYGFDYLLLSVDEVVGTDVTLTDDERWHVIDLLKKQGFMEEVQVGKLPYYRLTRKSFRGMHFSDAVDLIKLMDGVFLPLPKAANGASVSTPSAPAASPPRRPEPTESRRQRRRNERTAAAPNGAVAVESKAVVAPTVQAIEEARKEVEEVGAAAMAHEVPEAANADQEVTAHDEPAPATEASEDQAPEASDASGESEEFVATAALAEAVPSRSPVPSEFTLQIEALTGDESLYGLNRSQWDKLHTLFVSRGETFSVHALEPAHAGCDTLEALDEFMRQVFQNDPEHQALFFPIPDNDDVIEFTSGMYPTEWTVERTRRVQDEPSEDGS